MKNKIKYLLLSLGFISISPMITEAANLYFEGSPNKDTATYSIKYKPDDIPLDTIKLKINKTNEDLIYELKSDYGTCDETLSCTLITTTIKSESVLATLTVKNSTSESQKTEISIGGDIEGDSKSFTLATVATTTTTTKPVELRNTSDLSSINISVGVMDQTFDKNLTTYNVTGIKDTVNSITITPNSDDGSTWAITCPTGECSVSNTRRVNLQTGANKVAITVTSENGENNKTYILNVYRGEIETSSAYLSSLKIEDAILSPNFDSMVNDYTAIVDLDLDKLNIIALPEDPNANIEIKGNQALVEGENTVTITVTSSDNANKQVYTIIVTKEKIEEETEDEKKVSISKVEKKKNNTWLIVLLSLLGLALIIVVFLIIFKKKKKKNDPKDKNDKNSGSKVENTEILEKSLEEELIDDNPIEIENTHNLNILNETRKSMNNEPKQDIDEALDDLMKTKKLELGDLDF